MVTTIMMFIMSSVCLLLEVINTMGLVRPSKRSHLHALLTACKFEGILLETRGAFQDPTAWYSFKGANDRTLAQAAIFSFEVRSNLQTSSFFIVYCATSVHDRRWRRRVARCGTLGV